MRKLSYILLFLISITNTLFAQEYTQIDSILKIVSKAKTEEEIYQYLKIDMLFRHKNIDTACYYSKKALQLSLKIKNDSLIANSYNNLGLDCKLLGKYEKAEKYLSSSLEYSKKTNDSSGISSSLNNLGLLVYDKGNYNDALEYFIKSLEIAQAIADTESISLSYNNIGMIHYDLEDYDRALNYYEMSLELKLKMNDENGAALLYMNIGIIYYFKDDYDAVLSYFNKSLEIWERNGSDRQVALVKSNMAELYIELHQETKAIKYLIDAKKIYTNLNEVFDVIQTDLLIGQLYAENGEYDNAVKIFNLCLEKSKKAESISSEQEVYASFVNLYKLKSDYENAFKYKLKYDALKDSIFNEDKSNKIEELETKYQTEQKEKQIELMEKDKLVGDLKQKKMLITIYSISIGILLLIGLIIFVFRAYKIKKQAFVKINEQKDEITNKNAELNQRNEEILAQRDEIEQQRDIANEQRDVIYHQKEALTDSIEYALKIQRAIIPQDKEVKKILNEYFIFYLPKDVVSGDYYWVDKINTYTIVSVADCTGHGVPGAFMSMLGMSFLNEITKKPDVKHPNQVLELLRNNIIEALKQKGKDAERFDGMDMSLVVFNEEDDFIEYSGAYNPIYIISDKEVVAETENTKIKIFEEEGISKKLYEIAPDKMPVAIHLKMFEFSNHIIKVNKGDQLILFSDGFADQFGGEKGKKYRYKNFKSLLLRNSNKNLKEQYSCVNQEYKRWIGEREQIDDISILSFIYKS